MSPMEQVTVRVVLHDGLAALVGGAYTVVGHGPAVRGLFGRDDGHEDAVEFVPGLGRSLLGVYGDALGQWPEHSDGDGSGVVSGTEVTAQHFVRVVERCIAHRAQITLIHWHGSDIFIDVRVSSHNTEVIPSGHYCEILASCVRSVSIVPVVWHNM